MVGGLRIATTSSAAGATARIAVSGGCRPWKTEKIAMVEPQWRRQEQSDHLHCLSHRHGRNDWHGSNVGGVPLWTLHIEKQTSPVSFACTGTFGRRSCLGRGLDTPFTSQDKPPLAVAMVVTVNGVRSLRRYRLVIAQKSKLRLTQEVTAALASHSRDHRLTASGFFPCSSDREYCTRNKLGRTERKRMC